MQFENVELKILESILDHALCQIMDDQDATELLGECTLDEIIGMKKEWDSIKNMEKTLESYDGLLGSPEVRKIAAYCNDANIIDFVRDDFDGPIVDKFLIKIS